MDKSFEKQRLHAGFESSRIASEKNQQNESDLREKVVLALLGNPNHIPQIKVSFTDCGFGIYDTPGSTNQMANDFVRYIKTGVIDGCTHLPYQQVKWPKK